MWRQGNRSDLVIQWSHYRLWLRTAQDDRASAESAKSSESSTTHELLQDRSLLDNPGRSSCLLQYILWSLLNQLAFGHDHKLIAIETAEAVDASNTANPTKQRAIQPIADTAVIQSEASKPEARRIKIINRANYLM